ncbi:MAG: hypothetical protein ACRC5T_03295 [Cetobacterium sp.]
MRVTRKPTEIEAHQWFKLGDHPDDKLGEALSHPDFDGVIYRTAPAFVRGYFHLNKAGEIDEFCGQPWDDHGWLGEFSVGQCVCPGDWIVTENGRHGVVPINSFFELYDPVSE